MRVPAELLVVGWRVGGGGGGSHQTLPSRLSWHGSRGIFEKHQTSYRRKKRPLLKPPSHNSRVGGGGGGGGQWNSALNEKGSEIFMASQEIAPKTYPGTEAPRTIIPHRFQCVCFGNRIMAIKATMKSFRKFPADYSYIAASSAKCDMDHGHACSGL